MFAKAMCLNHFAQVCRTKLNNSRNSRQGNRINNVENAETSEQNTHSENKNVNYLNYNEQFHSDYNSSDDNFVATVENVNTSPIALQDMTITIVNTDCHLQTVKKDQSIKIALVSKNLNKAVHKNKYTDCHLQTVKKDLSIKIALDSKILKKAIQKNKYQMPNIDSLIQTISQSLSTAPQETAYFTTLDLQYAYSQLNLHNDTARHCKFNLVSGDMTSTYRFKTGFYCLTDMPAEFQKAIDCTLTGLNITFCFLTIYW